MSQIKNEINIYYKFITDNRKRKLNSFRIKTNEYFVDGNLIDFKQINKKFFRKNTIQTPSYVLSCIYGLFEKKCIDPSIFKGGTFIIISALPNGASLGFSSAIEVSTLYCLTSAYNIRMTDYDFVQTTNISDSILRSYKSCQIDPIITKHSKKNKIISINCAKERSINYDDIPEDIDFYGVDTTIKQKMISQEYLNLKIGAYMAHKILYKLHEEKENIKPDWGDFIANIPHNQFKNQYRLKIPRIMTEKIFSISLKIKLIISWKLILNKNIC